MRLWLALVAMLGGLVSNNALACRVLVTPKTLPVHPTVVVVKIEHARFVGDQSRFFTWQATARVKAVVAGNYARKIVTFGGAFQSAGCRDKMPPPADGNTWVSFYDSAGVGEELTDSFRLEVAEDLDPRVRAWAAARR
jgi:hypothetical protein